MASESPRRWLQLHASGAVFDGVAVVASAVMNSGKSTLVAGLVAAGAGYLTDEAVAVDLDDLVAQPYPKPIALDPGSFPLFPELAPTVTGEQARWEPAKWYVDPERVRSGCVAPPSPIGLVVLPGYVPGSTTTATLVDPLHAVVQLAGNCFNLVELGRPGLSALVRLAQRVPVYHLRVADLASGVSTVADLVDRLADPEARPADPPVDAHHPG